MFKHINFSDGLSIVQCQWDRLVLLGKSPVQHAHKAGPVWSGPHERHDDRQMFLQLRVPGLRCGIIVCSYAPNLPLGQIELPDLYGNS